MRSYFMQGVDGRATLECRDVEAPTPASGQLLVKMRAASVNKPDDVSLA